MPRLGYKKSRGGCARCKQRRVKCDENKPCGACIRHNTQCSLVESSLDGQSGSGDKMAWVTTATTTTTTTTTTNRSHSGPPREPSLQRKRLSRQRPSASRNTQTSTSPMDQSSPTPTPPILREESTLNLPADFMSDRGPAVGHRRSSVVLVAASSGSPDPFPYFDKFTTGPVAPGHLSGWITHLELMHHYSTATCLTLPRSDDASGSRVVWQSEVPRLGLAHTFLMHEVLAIAALHLGHLHPERRASYALHASRHQSDAIAGLRGSLAQITADNCHALFATSSLLLLNAYSTFPYQRGRSPRSSPRSSPPPQSGSPPDAPTVDDILDVFLLVRGMNHILSSAQPVIQAGPFAPFFAEVVTPASTPLLDAVARRLQSFRSALEETDDPDPDPSPSSSSKSVVAMEIGVFLQCITHAVESTATPEMRVALTWPINLTEEYLGLLRHRDPAALTLLAYYCAVVRSTEAASWFMQGWGVNAARAIVADLDPGWRDMIRWPLAFMSDRTIQL
ncbi:Sterol uptake control protein 2 [Colletotrichum tanaceti]|uniref:Sterol uptake control protein 2 n=1 Tax=Colletotrichum tanaceti TaxID=1306861 RepID=A0A4U6X694_9PEZI|nr:Sterol uptake control protein 2 [Colletotrichum tanaceti]TKW50971.1 Sterol uptake control protein 2 [Colletotrichum tanaceti]